MQPNIPGLRVLAECHPSKSTQARPRTLAEYGPLIAFNIAVNSIETKDSAAIFNASFAANPQ